MVDKVEELEGGGAEGAIAPTKKIMGTLPPPPPPPQKKLAGIILYIIARYGKALSIMPA